MQLTELVQQLQAQGVEGDEAAIAAKVQDYLSAASLTVADVTDRVVLALAEDMRQPTGKLAKGGAGKSLAKGGKRAKKQALPAPVNDCEPVGQQVKATSAVETEAEMVIEELQNAIDAKSEEIAARMLQVYDSAVPNGIALFAESVHNLQTSGHYARRGEYFREIIRSAI